MNRLPLQTMHILHQLLGGVATTETQVLDFIEAHYGVRNLFYLSHRLAGEIIKRPHDFLKAAKKFAKNVPY